MVNHLVSVDIYPVVTEETTVWRCTAVVSGDDGRCRTLRADPDDCFPTEQDAMDAALQVMKRFDGPCAAVHVGYHS
jgi:hypothetical protein